MKSPKVVAYYAPEFNEIVYLEYYSDGRIWFSDRIACGTFDNETLAYCRDKWVKLGEL